MMPKYWLTIGLILSNLFLFPSSSSYASLPQPWTDYVGSHYVMVPWARNIRDHGRSVLNNPGMKGKIEQLIEKGYVLLVESEGPGSGRNPEKTASFMATMERDKGESWKKYFFDQVMRLAKLPNGDRVVWQIGNEMNSRRYSETHRQWEGKGGKPGFNDEYIIPLYAEYYLAPSVVAITQASKEVFGTEDRIKIALGSVGNAYNPKSQQWLNALLSYRIKGSFAPELSGKRVADIVDFITIHYLLSTDRESVKTLDAIYSEWAGKGRIKGIWETEEIGLKKGNSGRGAATALKVAARFMHWANKHDISPAQGRFYLWGWELGSKGTSGGDGLQALLDLVGSYPLEDTASLVEKDTVVESEIYLFKVKNSAKRVAFIIADEQQNRPLKWLSIRTEGKPLTTSSELHVFNPTGHRTFPVAITTEKDMQTFSFPPEALSGHGTAILLMNEHSEN